MMTGNHTPEGGAFVRGDDTRGAEDPSTFHLVLREDLGAIPAGTRAFLVEDLSGLPDYDHGYKCFLQGEWRALLEREEDPRWVELEGRKGFIWTLPKAKLRRVA